MYGSARYGTSRWGTGIVTGGVVTAACAISTAATVQAIVHALYSGAITMNGVSSVVTAGNLHAVAQALIDASATISLIVGYEAGVAITAMAAMTSAALAYVIQALGFTGTVGAGSVLEIDCDKQTVTVNGANAVQYFTGDFLAVYPDSNDLVYADGEAARTAELNVKHEERYL